MKTRKFTLILLLAALLLGCQPGAQSSPALPTPSLQEEAANFGLTEAEAATLHSLEQVDAYPLYQMTYYAEYEPGGQTSPLRHAAPPQGEGGWACSLFAALADPGNRLYGRNFDWDYSPALVLFTQPQGGYASLSLVDIAFLGYEGDLAKGLTEKPLNALLPLLDAPYLPFDGMNEMGLVVGMAAVPPGEVPPDPHKPTSGSLGIIRLMLDQAADVAEAVAILQAYNIDFEGGPPIHYLLADRSGQAALVEFSQGQVHILTNADPWHQATNFLVSAAGGSGVGHCSRYDAIQARLSELQGALNPQQALDLLGDVSQEGTQWSVVYGLIRGEVHIALGRDYNQVHKLTLEPVSR